MPVAATRACERTPAHRARPDRAARRAFFAIAALLFAGSTALTVAWCASMAAMDGMPMPGGWTMSMAWMRMPGQTWADAGAAFVGMWLAMTAAMMLPSLAAMLWRCRQALARAGAARPGRLAVLAGAGYAVVWAATGLAVFALGVVLAALAMRVPPLARAVPLAAGAVVLIAGALQFTRWKARHLACCSAAATVVVGPPPAGAWRHGLRLGAHCLACSASWMAPLLVVGVMDLRAMAVAAVAITVERIAPGGDRIAWVFGGALVAAGLGLIAHAVRLG